MIEPNPFEVLGVKPGADEQTVRAAYRRMVKSCHPDQFQDVQQQKAAQEQLVRLNLAYEAALKLVPRVTVGFNLISQEEAKHFARRLIAQGNLESALRQLNRADSKDGEWFCLQGDILMALKQYENAHQSYREAVRREAAQCIKCAKCVSACPMGLEPYYLSKMTQKKGWDVLEQQMITSCIECGCCQSTCPSYLPLLDWIRLGKQTVMGIIRARAAAAPKK